MSSWPVGDFFQAGSFSQVSGQIVQRIPICVEFVLHLRSSSLAGETVAEVHPIVLAAFRQ